MTEEEEFEFRLRLERENAQAQPPVEEPMSPVERLYKDIKGRIKEGTILRPGEESFIRKTLQGAASGPLMGAVQAGASMLGNEELASKIAQTQKEGNLLGTLMQPEAWLTGRALPNVGKAWQAAAIGAGVGGLYGGLSATPEVENQVQQRATSGALGLGFGAAIPAVSSLARGAFSGTVNTAGAAIGNQKSIEKLASEAAKNLARNDEAFIKNAIQSRTQYVPGAKPTVAEAIAEQNIGQPFQKGGATIRMQKTLSGASEMEDVLPSALKAQKAAIESFKEGVEKSLAPVRTSLLRIANKTGVDTNPILQKISTTLSTPGTREAEMVKTVMPKIADKIASMKQSAPGIVDARDIYSLRKNMYKTIKDFSKESGTWDKKLGAKLERDIQLAIDDAIDSSLGNNMWSKGYMEQYSQRMASARAHEARLEAAKEISKQVKSSSKTSLTTGDVPQIPNVLSRPITVINYGLKRILGDANTPVAKEIARRMADPDEYAKLLALPQGNPTRQLVEKVLAITAGEMTEEGVE